MSRPLPDFVRTLGAAAVLCAFVASPVRAQEATDALPAAAVPPSHREALPLWEIGAVAVAAWQPAYPGSDQNLTRGLILPFGIYRGPILHVDGEGVRVRAYRTPRVEWDLSASAAFGSGANKVHARSGMPAIGTLGEIGPALRINLGDLIDARRAARSTQLSLPVRAVFEANGGVSHQGWTFEPRLTHTAWAGDSVAVVVNASALFGDRTLNHLFYGVDAPYATSTRPAYQAEAGLVALRVGVSVRHRINSAVRLIYFGEVESVRGAANEASPLVRSKQDAGIGVSLIWGVWHSAGSGTD